MAKGNFWTRSVRGRLGDMVFYKSNGEQMTRSYNGNPANPRTDAQLTQRIKWVDTCLAYDFLKPVIAETMLKRPQDQNNFNTFVAQNVTKTPLVKKSVAELAKEKGGAVVGEYTISKGNLSGFGVADVVAVENLSAQSGTIGVQLYKSDICQTICESFANGETEVTIPTESFIQAYMSAIGCTNSHIGIEFAFCVPALIDAPIFVYDRYFEILDGSLINSVTWNKTDGVWKTTTSSTSADMFTISVLANQSFLRIDFTSPFLSESAGWGYSIFRCQRHPSRDCQTASLKLNDVATEMLAELNDPLAVAEAVASYRTSSTQEDEQVFHG